MIIGTNKDLRVRHFDGRFMYIGTKNYEVIVLDFANAPESDQGGLYIWRYDRNPDPGRVDLDYDGHMKILGVDII